MARAASGMYRSVDSALETLAGLTSTAIRADFGTNSCRRPSRLAATSMLKILTPVALPPGLARLATRPSLTGSSPTPKTIGTVAVAALAASAAGLLPGVAITATRRRTRAAMSDGRRETGIIEGQHATIEYHWLEGQYERLFSSSRSFRRFT